MMEVGKYQKVMPGLALCSLERLNETVRTKKEQG